MLSWLLRKEGYILLVVGLISYLFYQSETAQKFETLDDYYAQTLSWKTCNEDFQCASFQAPIDYNNISQGSMKIEVLRRLADMPKKRLGSLVVNPGGPGASGIDYAYNADYVFSPDILDRYDVVGFDPRGVSRSTPIKCFNDKETDANYAADAKPDNAKELAQSVKDSAEFIAQCARKTKNLTSFSTANAARDMDILRALLGDSKLNYIGKSYGTFMGTLYAQVFPDRVGRMVLDGAVDPSISNFEQTKQQAVSFDRALQQFIKACAQEKDCTLSSDAQKATAQIRALLNQAAKKPLPLKNKKDKRTLSESLMVLGAASALYDSESGWPMLRTAIKEAQKGYGDTFIELADIYTGRNSDGTYPDNEFDSGSIIGCLDFLEDRTVAQIASDAQKIIKAAPIFGPYVSYGGISCRAIKDVHPLVAVKTATPSTILIIGTTEDPATPYIWALGLHKLLTNSQVLTYVGEGHTGHARGSICIDDAVDDFYLKATLPAKDLRCSA